MCTWCGASDGKDVGFQHGVCTQAALFTQKHCWSPQNTVTSMLRSGKGCECATKSCTKPNITVKQTHPIWSAGIRAHAPASASRRRSKKTCSLANSPPHWNRLCAKPNNPIQNYMSITQGNLVACSATAEGGYHMQNEGIAHATTTAKKFEGKHVATAIEK